MIIDIVVAVMLTGGDVMDADSISYASESTAAILMLVFQYVTNGGRRFQYVGADDCSALSLSLSLSPF